MATHRLGFSISLMLAALFISAPATTIPRASDDKDGQIQTDENEKRKALWKALLEACPQEYREIDVYAENPSLTQVCFRSKNRTFFFDIRRQKVEEQLHAKMLGRINRITFREQGSSRAFILWYCGEQELSLGVD
ncbi:MAG TPA: hypothetical protein VID27_05510 [Blastocatellia bacterium]|jgi:hypothetical protein